MIAALFVDPEGVYSGLPDVDCWGESRAALPSLDWGKAPGDFLRLDRGCHTAVERRRAIRRGACALLSHKQRAATPLAFRDVLLSMARSVTPTDEHGKRVMTG